MAEPFEHINELPSPEHLQMTCRCGIELVHLGFSKKRCVLHHGVIQHILELHGLDHVRMLLEKSLVGLEPGFRGWINYRAISHNLLFLMCAVWVYGFCAACSEI